MSKAVPSICAGHSVLCPYDANDQQNGKSKGASREGGRHEVNAECKSHPRGAAV
jgi:hypothetical protein